MPRSSGPEHVQNMPVLGLVAQGKRLGSYIFNKGQLTPVTLARLERNSDVIVSNRKAQAAQSRCSRLNSETIPTSLRPLPDQVFVTDHTYHLDLVKKSSWSGLRVESQQNY